MHARSSFVVAGSLALLGCESHPDVTFATPASPAASVVGTIPLVESVEIDPDSDVEVFFSKALDPSSVAASPPGVTGSNGEIAGSWVLDSTRLAFIPFQPLPYLDRIEVDLPAFVDVDGLVSSAHSFAFSTRDIEWTGLSAISTNASTAPVIAVARSGAVLAAWVESGTVRGSHRPAGGSWSAPAELETLAAAPVELDIALGDGGLGFVVFSKSDGANTNVYATRFLGGSWSAPQALDTLTASAERPRVGVDASGNAIAVWVQDETAIKRVFSARYSQGTWALPTKLGSTGAEPIGYEAATGFAMSPAGFAVAAWSQTSSVWAIRYAPGTGWENASLLDASGDLETLVRPVIDDVGNANVVWAQCCGGSEVWTVRGNGGSWGAAQLLSDLGTDATDLKTYGDPSGWTLAIWQANAAVMAARADPSGAWATAEELPDSTSPLMGAIDGSGRALAVWSVAGSLWGARATSSWGPAFQLETPTAMPSAADAAGLGFAADGRATAAWRNGGAILIGEAL